MPITASPAPYIRPSAMDAAMPAGSSVGWFGCRRTDMVPGKADRIPERGDDAALARGQHEILVAHQLRDRGGNFRRDARRQPLQRRRVRLVREQMIAQLAYRHAGDRSERRRVMRVDDQPRDLVVFVRNERLGQNGLAVYRQARASPPCSLRRWQRQARRAGRLRAGATPSPAVRPASRRRRTYP